MQEIPLRATIAAILDSVRIDSAASYSFAGQIFGERELLADPSVVADAPHGRLVAHLGRHLYRWCYCRTLTDGISSESDAGSPDEDVIEALAEANTSRERWDRGWAIDQILPSGQVLARRGVTLRTLWGGEYTTHDGPGAPPRAGMALSVFVPRESRTLQPTFYFAFGEASADQEGSQRLLRFYWNVRGDGAPPIMRALTGALNRFQVPFRLKCATRRSELARLDAMVLYVAARYYRVTSEILLDVYPRVAADLDANTPLFTKRLRPGLGFAEDPGTGESFGTHRCRLLAEGIWFAFEQGASSVEVGLRVVADHFERSGISLDRPFLNAGSLGSYDVPWEPSKRRVTAALDGCRGTAGDR